MNKTLIERIKAYELLDSRGNPTLGVEVIISGGLKAMSLVPSGASTGKYEAWEIRDKDMRRFNGKGLLKATNIINEDINKLLKGLEVTDQEKIDSLMCKADGTENKINFGANTILGVSLACAKLSAKALDLDFYEYLHRLAKEFLEEDINKRLPVPMMNILNGGIHADNALDFQEFMIQPVAFDSFKRSIQCGAEIFHGLKKILKKKKLSTSVGDEGGFAPQISSPEEAINLIIDAIEISGYKPGEEVMLAIDVAANEMLNKGRYIMDGMGRDFTSEELVDYFSNLRKNYPISSIEDGLAEDDWEGWKIITNELGHNTQLVGDDLFVTNHKRLQEGIDKKVANAVLIKVNQIGTLSETMQTIDLALKNDYKIVISHRSGETEDHTIADLSVAVGAGQIKTGSLSRSDRNLKYNRLLIIEENSNLDFLGRNEFS